jgi:hypothetical protein
LGEVILNMGVNLECIVFVLKPNSNANSLFFLLFL